VLYLGLELMSLCLYSMVALNRDSAVSTEAAMKYFILGALASGVLLYGMSMLYGATGFLNLEQIAQSIASGSANNGVLVFGLVFIVAGLAFKLGVVPFHMWIPDVYDGAPNAIDLGLAKRQSAVFRRAAPDRTSRELEISPTTAARGSHGEPLAWVPWTSEPNRGSDSGVRVIDPCSRAPDAA